MYGIVSTTTKANDYFVVAFFFLFRLAFALRPFAVLASILWLWLTICRCFPKLFRSIMPRLHIVHTNKLCTPVLLPLVEFQ